MCFRKGFVVTGLQIVTTGEHNTVIFRQLLAAIPNGIDTHHRFIEAVKHQMPPLLFLIGLDTQQDQLADFSKIKIRIIQRLVGILHWLGINTLAAAGVVFHLDGEITLDGVHENGIENIHVGMAAIHDGFTLHFTPFKIPRRWQFDLALTAIIQVLNLFAIGRHGPAEHPNIG